MKKILATVLALVFAMSLCACGDTSDGGTDKTSTPSNETSSSAGSAVSDSSQETGYVGTWKVIPPDENPFPPLYLVLNEDGTAGWGAKLENLSPRIWYECEDEDAEEGRMELAKEDKRGYGDEFYLTEDGKIYMEVDLSVGDNSYDHIYFERQ